MVDGNKDGEGECVKKLALNVANPLSILNWSRCALPIGRQGAKVVMNHNGQGYAPNPCALNRVNRLLFCVYDSGKSCTVTELSALRAPN